MSPTSEEIEKLIDNFDTQIKYYQELREYSTIQISKLLDAKSELLDTYRQEES